MLRLDRYSTSLVSFGRDVSVWGAVRVKWRNLAVLVTSAFKAFGGESEKKTRRNFPNPHRDWVDFMYCDTRVSGVRQGVESTILLCIHQRYWQNHRN